MGATEPTSRAAGAPLVRRRDFVVGGIAGLTGLAAGHAAGREADHLPPCGDPPTEEEAERKAAARTSYAQFGEDLALDGVFFSLKVGQPSYLDLGAYEPIKSNNTYLFYTRGGRGVLVEPNVDLTDKLRRLRPEDKLLVAGVGVDDTPAADYYVMTHPELNTFDRAQVDHLERTTEQRLVKVVKMPLLNVNRVMAEHFGGSAPDLLSIDIEGFDFAVLRTLDFARFRPKVICAETLVTATMRHNPDTLALMAEKGYELRGMTHPNTLFVDKRAMGA